MAEHRERTNGEDRRSSRRDALRIGGVVGLSLLAGCTEDVGEELPPDVVWPVAAIKPSLPVRERTDVLADGIEGAVGADVGDVDSFVAALENRGVAIDGVIEERDVLAIGYPVTERWESGPLHDLGPIAGAYAALVGAGYDGVALAVTIIDAASGSIGSATVETTWAERYLDDDLTAGEFGAYVAGTIESRRHPPEIAVTPDE